MILEPSAAKQLLERLYALTSTLPASITMAGVRDVLVCFAVDPCCELDDGDDLYKVCVDHTLSNAVGYEKGVVEVAHIIHQGALGMDSFCKWIQICLVNVGIAVALLEVRVERVCDAMKLLCIIPQLCLPNAYDNVM